MRSLTLKLTLAFLIVGLSGAALVALFSVSSTTTAFDRFRIEQSLENFAANMRAYYEQSGSWEGAGNLARRSPRENNGPGAILPPHVLVNGEGRVVVGFQPYRAGQQLSTQQLSKGIRIEVNGRLVGTALNVGDPNRTVQDRLFLAQLTQALVWAALGATLFALLLGLGLARTLTRPLVGLTRAAQRIAGGDFGQTVDVQSEDEIGQLAVAFNRMSSELARSAHLRRQMTADIAHELRSPLSVLMGYTESLSEGVLHPTPAILRAMHEESRLLSHLVDDLRTLSLADAGELTLNRVLTGPGELLERVAASYTGQARAKGVDLRLALAAHLPSLALDPERYAQVLGNLVGNAIRYTPPGGRITLAGSALEDGVLLEVIDTGSGIAPEQLPHIFERFYRADSARTVNEAESGLGLSIAKSLVELHGHTLTVESRVGQGTTMRIHCPR
ncbi:MAG: HAMP domain-containing protein [Caldilineaceae bacterium]|nr:HAMP domain-containing protein [Caldilineaceae bacterium]HRJ42860.1 ATP-binding protein [Caldilineaceae bacterium]